MATESTQAVAAHMQAKPLMVYPSQLKERVANNRFAFGAIDELAKSIRAVGVQNALQVRKIKEKTEDGYPMYEVVVGNRRLKACQRIAKDMAKAGEAETAFIPVFQLSSTVTEMDCVVASLTTDLHGLTRNMLEIGYDLKILVDGGMSKTNIAKTIGKSTTFVADALYLVENITDELTQQIKDNTVSAYNVLEMLKAGTGEEAEATIQKAAAKKSEKLEASGKSDKKVTLKKSELKEASGKPQKASSYGKERNVEAPTVDAPEKEDATMAKLNLLRDAMKAYEGEKKQLTFGVMNTIRQFLQGKLTQLEIISLFFWGEDEEADKAFIEAAQRQAPAAAAPKKAAPNKKATDDDLDEDEPAAPAKKGKKEAPAKPTKGAQSIKDKKAAAKKRVAEDEPADDELEEGLNLDDEDDDDFME